MGLDRLDRYVAHQVLLASLGVAAVFVALDWLLAFIDQVDGRGSGYGLVEIIEFVLLTSPRRFWELVPYVAMLGALVGLSMLGARGELVVMRAAGRSLPRLTAAAALPAIALVLVGGLLGELVGPGAEDHAQTLRALARDGAAIRVRGGSWHQDGPVLTQADGVTASGELFGVWQYEFAADGALQAFRHAERAAPETRPESRRPDPDGAASGVDGDAVGGTHLTAHWRLYEVTGVRLLEHATQPFVAEGLRWRSSASAERLRLSALVTPERLSIDRLVRRLEVAVAERERAELQLALLRKLSQPLAVLALVLVGAAFVFGPLRERDMGVRLGSGVLVGLAFRYVQELLAPVSLVFGLPPVLAVAVPILVAVVLGVVLLRRAG